MSRCRSAAAGVEARRSARRGAAADGAGIAALIAIAVLWAWTCGGSTFAPLAIGLAVFVISGALCDLAERTACSVRRFATAMPRARGLPRATWGTAFAHAGVGIALIGIVCETTWNSEYIGSMKPNDVAKSPAIS
jgi:cytochrome c-type biogenesis protein CcmF